MLDGTMVDVAIGVIVIFLVASLIASAIVEAIGGLFHRREKHLWDSLDLLLGNTSVDDDPNARRIVGELYKTPFITGLVKPSNRPYFDSAEGSAKRAVGEERLPKPRTRAEPRTAKSRVDEDDDESINRRYYGPQAINARDFARGLIDVIRPGGDIDQALERADGLLAGVPDDDTATVAVDQLQGALAELDDVARATGSGDLSAAIESIRNAGDQIDVASLKAAVARINQTLTGLRDLSPDSIRAGIGLLPRDLRTKLGEVVESTTDDVAAIRRNVEDWFDRNMAAASMWYRRQTRWFLFAAGLVPGDRSSTSTRSTPRRRSTRTPPPARRWSSPPPRSPRAPACPTTATATARTADRDERRDEVGTVQDPDVGRPRHRTAAAGLPPGGPRRLDRAADRLARPGRHHVAGLGPADPRVAPGRHGGDPGGAVLVRPAAAGARLPEEVAGQRRSGLILLRPPTGCGRRRGVPCRR